MPRRVHWEEYDRCETCGVPRGTQCVNVHVWYTRPIKTPHKGRRHLTRAATEILREADQ